jgi:hypothetical protein
MQGGNQVLWSTQKRLEDVKRIREAIATGASILTDQERRKIIRQAALPGEDGEIMIEEILDRVREDSTAEGKGDRGGETSGRFQERGYGWSIEGLRGSEGPAGRVLLGARG